MVNWYRHQCGIKKPMTPRYPRARPAPPPPPKACPPLRRAVEALAAETAATLAQKDLDMDAAEVEAAAAAADSSLDDDEESEEEAEEEAEEEIDEEAMGPYVPRSGDKRAADGDHSRAWGGGGALKYRRGLD